MDRGKSAIGVFDSGVGGVSVLKALQRALPNESFIYVADSANAPYGDKSTAFIEGRTSATASFLVASHAKAIVVACNTATVVAVQALRAHYSIPVIAMEPAIKPAVQLTRSGVVGVLATERTLESPALAALCRRFGETVEVIPQPCPGLVEAVERGEMDAEATAQLLRRYVEPLLAKGADTLVLGCTHYVNLSDQIQRIAGPGITIVESSAAVARQLERRLAETGNLSDGMSNAETRFFTTGRADQVQPVISALWGATVHVQAIEAPDARTVA
ncbi:MAG: glutamate racemase [Deferrisomatales bacterium]|nr:glutamate racemase [Deferrisomatales bacterium]